MAIIVGGFNSDGYFINSPVFIDISFVPQGGQVLSYFTLKITNSQQNSGDIKIYPRPGSNSVRLNLSPVLKSMFKTPKHNTNYSNVVIENSAKEVFNFLFTANFKVSDIDFSEVLTVQNRTFYRGGLNNNNFYNHTAAIGRILRKTEILPFWNGYPTAEYTIDENRNIVKNPLMQEVSNKEFRLIHGCNNQYLKFLNSLGGYSYWLFEGSTESKSTSNLGYSNTFNNAVNFGNEVTRNLQLYSKVPSRFYPLIQDLVESPEVYIYNFSDMDWYPIINKNNTADKNNAKKSYEVKLNFDVVSNYNPSLLW